MPIDSWWNPDRDTAAAKEVLDLLRGRGYRIGQVKEILQTAIDALNFEPLAPKKACPEGQTEG